jgi:curli biogenesis system outer membrane secretion channel CsgG
MSQSSKVKSSSNGTSVNQTSFSFQKFVIASAAALVCGFSFAQAPVETADTSGTARLHCDKPVAKVMVGKLTCKAASCNSASAGNGNPIMALLAAAGQPNVSGIGDGIKDMMTTALQNSGCFEVMDRDAMDEIKKELAAAGLPMVTEAADFLVTGSLTQIEMEKSSTNFGWGLIPVIGSIGMTTQKASVGLDLRLVSVASAKVVGSKRIESSTEDSSFGVGGIGFGTAGGALVGFGGSFSSLKGTSLEKVTRDAIYKATDFLIAEARNAKSIVVVQASVATIN